MLTKEFAAVEVFSPGRNQYMKQFCHVQSNVRHDLRYTLTCGKDGTITAGQIQRDAMGNIVAGKQRSTVI